MKILLVGGGTSGHVLPTLSVGRSILAKDPGANILYLGSLKLGDRSLATEAGFRFIGVPAGKWRRYFDLRNVVDILITLAGIIVAFLIVLFFWPDRIFIKGGYVGLPVGIAAWLLRRPIILHESDAVMGTANRMLMKFARQVCVSFPLEVYPRSKKLVYTGVPVNELFFSKEVGDLPVKLREDMPLVLVIGGSQGARAVNKLVRGAAEELAKHYQIVHLAGGLDYATLHRWLAGSEVHNYYLFDFLPSTKIATLTKKAAVVISRAGATVIAEIAAVGRPAILIPLPGAANNHQYLNAKYLADRGAAVLLEQSSATPGLLIEKVNKIIGSDLGKRLSFNITAFSKKDASARIAELLLG
ncbi:undecaprenyldiphospho-muramoylpentapeptide beta-N-acetylglucosaminyltransferase [candidate division Kazan bacterium RBG_13_50_9]|uniref:UDP-N-acetylglucosamine--N-acetylmuramyl-(pentapeptide) pyrophosphoryl-undecaprenol N-acetylglucosamine transferase n=1 Tax=candidate division Kazan bacterium RBG_13_50_9 TaxID=1798535 RepID=A0A1F4NS79_UNCK3|nr:MAG: undecaprenyldiphospho-muramoylpentapeptide beta-N-acetylglucosaminyltransferase [candidate division Kazan bacterium RBG_13_50_9]